MTRPPATLAQLIHALGTCTRLRDQGLRAVHSAIREVNRLGEIASATLDLHVQGRASADDYNDAAHAFKAAQARLDKARRVQQLHDRSWQKAHDRAVAAGWIPVES